MEFAGGSRVRSIAVDEMGYAQGRQTCRLMLAATLALLSARRANRRRRLGDVDYRGELRRYLPWGQQPAHITRQIQRREQTLASLAQVAVIDQEWHAAVQRFLLRLQQVTAKAMAVVGGGRRWTCGQTGHKTFPHGQTRPVDPRLDGSQLEAQHTRDVLERDLGNLCKNQRKPQTRRQSSHR